MQTRTSVSLTIALSVTLAVSGCATDRKHLAGTGVTQQGSTLVRSMPLQDIRDVLTTGDRRVRVLVKKHPAPVGVAVLFAGGTGALQVDAYGNIKSGLRGNFLIRSESQFRQNGYITAMFDSPSNSAADVRPAQRGQTFANDIGEVIRDLREQYKLPVWLVGTSRGTLSVANAISQATNHKPDGAVLTASITNGSNGKGDVFEFPLSNVKVPVFIAHHKSDNCVSTPPHTEAIAAKLSQSPAVKVQLYTGGLNVGSDCEARAYHGFNGIEPKVVADITTWMKAH